MVQKSNYYIQLERMLKDKEKYGDEQSGTYRGIDWSMKRRHNVFWCGYLHLPPDMKVSDEKYAKLDQIAHGGFTADFGFDCAHGKDLYSINQLYCSDKMTYKDHDYVKQNLMDLIDCLLS